MESVKKRQEEATSKETLEDLENSEASVDTDEAEAPSPDGAFDEEDEMNNAEPI
jgi:hypothetical protein